MIPVIDRVATGKRIHELIANSDIRIQDVQDRLYLNVPQTIYKWFRGDSLPTIDNLVILSRLFGVTVDDILVIQERGD